MLSHFPVLFRTKPQRRLVQPQIVHHLDGIYPIIYNSPPIAKTTEQMAKTTEQLDQGHIETGSHHEDIPVYDYCDYLEILTEIQEIGRTVIVHDFPIAEINPLMLPTSERIVDQLVSQLSDALHDPMVDDTNGQLVPVTLYSIPDPEFEGPPHYVGDGNHRV